MFIWFVLKDQLQSITYSINDLDANVADPKAWYYADLDFAILFVGILSLYAINLGVVSLFADPSFTFYLILIMLLYLMYTINLNE